MLLDPSHISTFLICWIILKCLRRSNCISNHFITLSLDLYVCTKDWTSSTFSISRGVFQGDTLSPLLFLIVFNPIIQSIAAHPACGFSLTLEYEGQGGPPPLPKLGSYIYTLWDEESSDEDQGWYLAKILSITEEGKALLGYRSGGKMEEIHLPSIKWAPAKGT